MPEPAEIIAATLLRPPAREDAGILQPVTREDTGNGLQWSYRAAMAHPAAPGLAMHIACAVVEALGEAGWVIAAAASPVRSSGALPTPRQMRNWLICHQWKPGSEGPAGTMWAPPVRGRGVGVPLDGDDPDLIAGAVERIAARSAMSAEQVLAEMLTYADD